MTATTNFTPVDRPLLNTTVISQPRWASNEYDYKGFQSQLVRVRAQDQNIIIASSKDAINLDDNGGSYEVKILFDKDMVKIRPSSYILDWDIPNVNIYNNTVTIKPSDKPALSFQIPVGHYTSISGILGALIASGNTALTAVTSAVRFAVLIGPAVLPVDSSSVRNLAITGGTLFFLPSTMTSFDSPVVGLPVNSPTASNIKVGPNRLIYTRSVNIVSRNLTQASRNSGASSNRKGRGIIESIMISTATNINGGIVRGDFSERSVINLLNNTLDDSFDISLTDERGNELKDIYGINKHTTIIFSGEK